MSTPEHNHSITCRTIHGEEREVSANELSFRPSVYGVILKGDTILLSPQWDGYDFPGGGIDKGETIMEALIREVKEETGINVRPGALLHVTEDFFIRPKSEEAIHSILMYYQCEFIGGELSAEHFSEWEKDILKIAEWVPLEKALTTQIRFYNPIDSAALIRKAVARA